MIYDSIAKTIKVSRTAEGQQFDQDWTVSAEGTSQSRLHCYSKGEWHMVSMKDIAEACGVSVASVSKALNNHTDIGEETRQLIRRTQRKWDTSPIP